MIIEGRMTSAASPNRFNGPPSTKHSEMRKIKLESDLKSRLAMGWRRVYRAISKQDPGNTSKITAKQFSSICHQNDVFLSREELLRLCRKYGSYALLAGPNDAIE